MEDTYPRIPIIYEDEHLLAVNKPAGLVVHSDGRTKEPTLADWVAEHYPKAREVGEPLVLADGTEIARPGIVHRLDRDTSGVIVIAKDQETFLFLKEQFQNKKVQKVYRALVYGVPKEREGVINVPIGKARKDFRKWLASEKARGTLREAVTEYKMLSEGRGAAYVEVYPKTGRTHQIRVHFKAIGHPVLCDPLYGAKDSCLFGLTRQALHGWRVTLAASSGGTLTLEAPLPDDFVGALKMAGIA